MSAPASTYAFARATAASNPSTPRASVRAQIMNPSVAWASRPCAVVSSWHGLTSPCSGGRRPTSCSVAWASRPYALVRPPPDMGGTPMPQSRSRAAFTAARTFSTACSSGTSFFPSRCPHRLGNT